MSELKKYYDPTTTEEVLSKVAGLSMEDLVLLRIKLARVHLDKSRTKNKADQMMKNRMFWNWWLRIWETMDKQFLHDLELRNIDTCNVQFYEDKHLTKCTKMRWVYKIPKESVKV